MFRLTSPFIIIIIIIIIVNDPNRDLWLNYEKRYFSIGHFRVTFRLCFKARPSAKPFIWKLVLFTSKWTKMLRVNKTNFLMKGFALGLASFIAQAKSDSEMIYYTFHICIIIAVFSEHKTSLLQNPPRVSYRTEEAVKPLWSSWTSCRPQVVVLEHDQPEDEIS